MDNPGYASKLLPWQGMLLYLVVGVVWVFVGDALLIRWVRDPEALTHFQTKPRFQAPLAAPFLFRIHTNR